MKGTRSNENPEHPTLEGHPGLDSDEATDAGKLMTATGSTALASTHEQASPTLDDHPGLDNDEATEEGRMMTATGSKGQRSSNADEAEGRTS